MPLESATFISQLTPTNPAAGDLKSEGDDHLRLLKSVLQSQFPNLGAAAVTPTAAEINALVGVASTGASLKVTTQAASDNTTSAASTAMVQAAILASSGISASLPAQAGNAGRFLSTNGTTPAWSVPTPPALVLLATLTPTAAANVDFLTTFNSTYNNYLIIGEGIKPATDDALQMRFAVAGSVASTSNYFSPDIGAAGTASTAFLLSTTVTGAGTGCGFTIQIQNANDASRAKTGTSFLIGQSAGTPAFTPFGKGIAFNAANAISGFRLYWGSASNFSAVGAVRVYGYSNT